MSEKKLTKWWLEWDPTNGWLQGQVQILIISDKLFLTGHHGPIDRFGSDIRFEALNLSQLRKFLLSFRE